MYGISGKHPATCHEHISYGEMFHTTVSVDTETLATMRTLCTVHSLSGLKRDWDCTPELLCTCVAVLNTLLCYQHGRRNDSICTALIWAFHLHRVNQCTCTVMIAHYVFTVWLFLFPNFNLKIICIYKNRSHLLESQITIYLEVKKTPSSTHIIGVVAVLFIVKFAHGVHRKNK